MTTRGIDSSADARVTVFDLLANGANDAPAIGDPERDSLDFDGLKSLAETTVTALNDILPIETPVGVVILSLDMSMPLSGLQLRPCVDRLI